MRQDDSDLPIPLSLDEEPRTQLFPEQALFHALIRSALYEMRSHPYKVIRQNAAHWIMGANAGITFEQACLGLGVDPDVLRERLKRKYARELWKL